MMNYRSFVLMFLTFMMMTGLANSVQVQQQVGMIHDNQRSGHVRVGQIYASP